MPNSELLTGNVGEWSEIYVFFHLLGEGKIYAADDKMRKIPDSYLQIIKVMREESAGINCEYSCGESIRISVNGETHSNIPCGEFAKNAAILLAHLQDKNIAHGKGSFSLEPIQRFMSRILVNKIKAPNVALNQSFGGKADITMEVLDPNSGMSLPMGFSIKSEISSPPTLINASGATNFVFEVHGITDDQMETFNSIATRNKIIDRMTFLKEIGADIDYIKPLRQQAADNLVVLSDSMDQLVAEALRCFYCHGISRIDDVIAYLVAHNPLGFRNPEIVYRSRMKEFLYACFCGLNLGEPWDGSRNVNGGYIIVDSSGEVLAYHTIIQDAFKSFLMSCCKLEKGSTTKHKYGQIYKDGDKYLLNLNLQIRFI